MTATSPAQIKTTTGSSVEPPDGYLLSLALSNVSVPVVTTLSSLLVAGVDLFHFDHFSRDHERWTSKYLDNVAAAAVSWPLKRYDVHCFERFSELSRLCSEYMTTNPNLRTFYVHVDLRTLAERDLGDFCQARSAIEPRAVKVGVALQSFTGVSARLDEIERIVSELRIQDVLVMGPGPDGTIEKFRRNTLKTVECLVKHAVNGRQEMRIGIDRLITPTKVHAGLSVGATDFVIGSYVLADNMDPANKLQEVRAALGRD